MKKLFYSIGICLIAVVVIFAISKTDKKTGLKKVRVGEVTHTVFYAPQYIADKLGYFEDEKLDVELILIAGATRKSDSILYNKFTALWQFSLFFKPIYYFDCFFL